MLPPGWSHFTRFRRGSVAAGLVALAAAAALAGCGERGPEGRPDSPPSDVYTIVGDTILYDQSTDDTLLLRRVDLDVDRSTLVVADALLPGAFLIPLDAAAAPGEPEAIGREGEGPFEFRGVRAVALGQDRVAVLDRRNLRVSLFDRSGSPVTEISVPSPADVAFDAQGRLHVAVIAPVDGDPEATVQVLDPVTGDVVGGYGHYEDHEPGLTLAMHNTTRLAPTPDGGMWYAYPYRGSVYRVDAGLQETAGVILVDPDVPPADSYVQFQDEARMVMAVTREVVLADITSTDRGDAVVLASLDTNREDVRPRQVFRWYGVDGALRGEEPAAGSPYLRVLAGDGAESLYTLGATQDYRTLQVRRHRVEVGSGGIPVRVGGRGPRP